MGLKSKRKSGRVGPFTIISKLEKLENRQLLSGTAGAPDSITQDNTGLVVITGTMQSDGISVGNDPNNAANWLFAVITPGVNTVTQSFSKASVTGVDVFCDTSVSGVPIGPDADTVNFGGFVLNGTLGISLGQGADTVFGQNGPNVIDGSHSHGVDALFGGIGNDTIRGGLANNRIVGGQGNDILLGGSGDNVINGGGGNDQVVGGGGHDTLRAGPGLDTVTGGNSSSLLIGGSGNDFIQGGTGDDTIIGGGGANSTLLGGPGNDFIAAHWENFLAFNGGSPFANSGNAQVFAGGGNDTLASLGGSDNLTGGGGANFFDIGANAGIVDPGSATYVSESDVSTSVSPAVSLNITLTINLNLGGSIFPVTIPVNSGATPTPTSTAMATNGSGNIHFRSDGPRVFTLSDFFNHWGVNFSSSGVGQFETLGNGHTIGMTVNGVANGQFGAYAVQNGDNIVITYTQ